MENDIALAVEVPPVYRYVKYPNRRLYDPIRCDYVSLHDVLLVVKSGERIYVFDRKTQADITREILLDILVLKEREQPTLDMDALARMIRA